VPVRADSYQYNPQAIEAAIHAETRLIFVNTRIIPPEPWPTWRRWKPLRQLPKKHNLLLVSDEAYEHILFDGRKHTSWVPYQPPNRTVSVFSMSKTYAMSGLRLGYLVLMTRNAGPDQETGALHDQWS